MSARTSNATVVLLLSFAGSVLLSSCMTPEEKTDRYRARWDDMDAHYYERMDRKRERSQRMDDRYDAWWDSVMGR